MSRYPKTYRNFWIFRKIFTVIVSLAIAAVVLFVVLFFGLKKYIVYTDDGIRLEIPFLSEASEGGNP